MVAPPHSNHFPLASRENKWNWMAGGYLTGMENWIPTGYVLCNLLHFKYHLLFENIYLMTSMLLTPGYLYLLLLSFSATKVKKKQFSSFSISKIPLVRMLAENVAGIVFPCCFLVDGHWGDHLEAEDWKMDRKWLWDLILITHSSNNIRCCYNTHFYAFAWGRFASHPQPNSVQLTI